MTEAKRGRLDNERIGFRIFDGRHQRSVGIPGRDDPSPRPLEHVSHQGDHGGLAVRSRHRVPGAVVPTKSQVRLIKHSHPSRPGRREDRVAVRHAGGYHHLVDLTDQVGPRAGSRRLH